MFVALGAGLSAFVWWSLPGHVRTAKAQAATTLPLAQETLRIYTFTGLTTTTLGGTWTVTDYLGNTVSLTNLADFHALTFTAYNQGGFPSGQNVTLEFDYKSTRIGLPLGIDRIATGIVDQLDGDLYMKGDFGTSGWEPGADGSVVVAPLVGQPPVVTLPSSQALTVTLTGYCDATALASCPGNGVLK